MAANASAIGSIEHVGVLVRNLDRAMEHYANDLGIGPWAVYTLSPDWIRDMTVHGKEQGYVYKLALCNVGPVLYELMELVQGSAITYQVMVPTEARDDLPDPLTLRPIQEPR